MRDHPRMAMRIGMALACAAALAWLAVVLHSVALRDDGQEIAARDPKTLSAAEVAHSLSLLRRAQAHTPDTEPLLDRGALLVRLGQVRRATPLLEQIVDREPENVQAWALLALATQRTDPARAAEARARTTKLAPQVPLPGN
jgi:Flp pilus assembly protein TadD